MAGTVIIDGQIFNLKRVDETTYKATMADTDLMPYSNGTGKFFHLSFADLKVQLGGISSGFVGALSIVDTPTSDGIYIASESGTYTNAGGIVIDLSEGLTLIVKSGIAYTKIVIPIDLTGVVQKSEVVNDLTTGGIDVPLSAQMGRDLHNEIIDAARKKIDLPSFLNDPLNTFVGIVLLGDSITWGMSATGIEDINPRSGALTDKRNNSSSDTWANLLHKYIGRQYLNTSTFVETLTNSAAGGVNCFTYSVGKKIFPMPDTHTFVAENLGTDINKQEWGFISAPLATLKSQLNAHVSYSTDDFRLSFKMTGYGFKLIFSSLVAGAKYNLYVDEVLIGTYSTQSGDMGVPGGYGYSRQHDFGSFKKEALVEFRVIPGDASRTDLRVEAIEVEKTIRVTNQGIIGIDTNGYKAILPQAIQEGDSLAFVQLGTNDRLQASSKIDSITNYEKNITEIISVLKIAKIEPILMAANAVVTETYNYNMSDIRGCLAKVSESNFINFIDNFRITKDILTTVPYPLQDGVHPTDFGHDLIFRNVINSINI